MRPAAQLVTLPCGLLLLTNALSTAAGDLNLEIKPGLFAQGSQVMADQPPESGLKLAIRHEALNVDLDYDFQVKLDDQGIATQDNTSQRLAATVRSSLLDRMFGIKSRIRADSVVRAGGHIYDHKINPRFSRSLLNLATLDVGYQYKLNKPAIESAAKQNQSYTFGLRGSLDDGRLNWSGTYSASDTFEDQALLTQSTELLKLQSDYRVAPAIKVVVTSAVKQQVNFRRAGDDILAETRYGAGLRWEPSTSYSLDLAVNRQLLSSTGQDNLLHSGTLSWLPRHDLALSFNYGDQLLEGARGVMLTARLDLENL